MRFVVFFDCVAGVMPRAARGPAAVRLRVLLKEALDIPRGFAGDFENHLRKVVNRIYKTLEAEDIQILSDGGVIERFHGLNKLHLRTWKQYR